VIEACNRHGAEETECRALLGKSEEKEHLEEQGVDGRISLKHILKSNMMRGCVLNSSVSVAVLRAS
jgi:hypothetical protein